MIEARRPGLAAAGGLPNVLLDLMVQPRVAVDAAAVIAGTTMTAALAQISLAIPPSPVPVTGQTLAVGLVGAALGARRGMAALGLYLLVGLFIPVYAGGAQGWAVLTGPTGGYIVGFVFAAWAMGRLAERGADRRVVTALAAFAGSQLIIFMFGLIGLELAVGRSWSWTVHNGFTIFIAGGVIKAIAGAALLPGAWRVATWLRA